MNSNKISVITCSMNRDDNLKNVVKSTNELVNLHEHLIIDFSSDKEIQIDFEKINPKSKLIRVEKENVWWLSRAYNFGAYLAEAKTIMKLDADTVVDAAQLNELDLSKYDYLAFKIRYSLGNFIIKKTLFDEINGFNEYIYNWGFDDIDLFERVKSKKNKYCEVIPGEKYINIYDHNDQKRFNTLNSNYSSLSLAFHKKNRFVSSKTDWSKENTKSYKNIGNNEYLIEHFYSIKDKNVWFKLKYKKIFFAVYLNEKYKTNLFSRFNIFIILIPYFVLKTICKVDIYPRKK